MGKRGANEDGFLLLCQLNRIEHDTAKANDNILSLGFQSDANGLTCAYSIPLKSLTEKIVLQNLRNFNFNELNISLTYIYL